MTLVAALFWIWVKSDRGVSRSSRSSAAIAGLLLGFVWLQTTALPDVLFRNIASKSRIDRINQLRITKAPCRDTGPLVTFSAVPDSWRQISSDPIETRRRWSGLATALAVGLISMSLAGDERSRLLMIFVLAINGAAFGVLALFMRASSPGLIYWSIKPQWQPNPFGAFVNRNHAGLFFALSGLFAAFGIAFLLSQRIVPRFGKSNDRSTDYARKRSVSLTELRLIWLSQKDSVLFFFAFCALFCGVSSIAAASRSGILAFGAVVLFAAMMLFLAGADRRLILVIGVLGVIAAIVSGTNLEFLVNRFETNAVQAGWFGRFAHWKDVLEQDSEFAFTGTGYGTYAYATLPYVSNVNSVWFKNADNQFVESFVELGAVGSAIIFAFAVCLGIRCTSLLRSQELQSKIVGLFGCGILAICFINAMADFALIMPGVLLPMAVAVGLVLGFRTQETPHETSYWEQWGATYSVRGAAVAVLVIAAAIGLSQLATSQREIHGSENAVQYTARALSKVLGEPNLKAAANDAEESIASFLGKAIKEIKPFDPDASEEAAFSLENMAMLERALHTQELDADFAALRDALKQLEPLREARSNYLAMAQVAPMRFENHLALAKLNLFVCPGPAVSEEIAKVRQINPLSGPDSARAGIVSIVNGDIEQGGEMLGQALRQEVSLERDIFKVLKSELTVQQVAKYVLKQDPALLIRAADQYYANKDEWFAKNFLYAQLRTALEAGQIKSLSTAEAKYYLAKTQRMAGDHQIALQTFAEACEEWNAPIEWHKELAAYYQERGNLRKAKSILMHMQSNFGYDPNRDKQIENLEKRIRASTTLLRQP